MDMQIYFFEVGCDEERFAGLLSEEERELCNRHMGKYPVSFVYLKEVTGSICKKRKECCAKSVEKKSGDFNLSCSAKS